MKPQEKKSRFSLTYEIEPMLDLARKTGHKALAIWAADCVERVLHYFEERFPEDDRPRNSIKALQAWIHTGAFRMPDIRGASLAAHAAAREVGEDTAARSAARAAGQAVATVHVPAHSVGAAQYVLQAFHRAANSCDAGAAVAKERDWQYRHLLGLRKRFDQGRKMQKKLPLR